MLSRCYINGGLEKSREVKSTFTCPVLPSLSPTSIDLANYCMAAANSKGREIAGRFGKQLASQIRARPLLISRSASELSFHYDKEIDEKVRPEGVPDHVIGVRSDKYWAPHPITGVFGPVDPNSVGAASTGLRDPSAAGNGVLSALDQTVRFRHLDHEDLDKPLHHN